MSLKISVLAIGDELLNGELADTNTRAIARILGDAGYRLRESLTVGDGETEIGAALLELAGKREVVIVTGGLGPTGDDLTARAAARALGRRLTLHDEALTLIRDHFRHRGQEMHPRNEKQALLPQKATILPNSQGTAPGFLLHYNGSDLFFLPGVPAEMTAILTASVLPRLEARARADQPRAQHILKVFGLPEPRCEELLETAGLPPGIQVAFGLEFPEVHVKLRASGAGAEVLVDRAEVVARRALGDFVVAVDDQTLAGNVARLLSASGLTLGLAESCTGGLLAKLLTDLPGASAFLERSAITYADQAKADWLGVPEKVLAGPGAVSEECALAMARGIRAAAGSNLGLAVTGIAGPDGGSPQKPVGTVFLALAAAEIEQVKGYHFSGDRQAIRLQSASMALAWLYRYLIRRQSR
jgi:nicotinamide-nucleotide amidase